MEKLLSIVPKPQVQKVERRITQLDPKVFGEKIGLIAYLFGYWHKNLSRPFSNGKTAYRTCLKCGSGKPFDLKTFETLDVFDQPPIVRKIEF